MKLQNSQNYSQQVVDALKEIRLKKGLSQNSVAEMAGVSRGAIQHIEKGIRNPTVLLCHAIASSLGVSLADVLKTVEKSRK